MARAFCEMGARGNARTDQRLRREYLRNEQTLTEKEVGAGPDLQDVA
jgi:hypothetical protein